MGWISRTVNVFRQDRLLRRLDDELAFHVAERIDELVAAGLTPDAARTEALRRFGNYTRQRERTRDMNIVAWLEAVVGDLKYGARQLRLNPGFATVAVLSLALGIGANTAIFQLINALRLRSLPAVHEPHALASIGQAPDFIRNGWGSSRHTPFTYPQFEFLRRSQSSFTDLLAFGTTRFNLTRSGEARYADGLWVSTNFLDVLGITPAFGGGFVKPADERDCSQAGVLLSHAFWQRQFGGDPKVVGREMFLHGRSFPIVGVTPAAFIGLEPGRQFDVALPLCTDTLFALEPTMRRLDRRDAWWLSLVGRLKPGVTVERASTQVKSLSAALFRETLPPSYRPTEAGKYLKNQILVEDARAGLSSLRRRYEDPLIILFSVAGMVLLIACANLANLLLARSSARQREMAVRQAVGASRRRLIGQLCAESMLIATIGALLGLVVAQVASRALVAFLSSDDAPIVLSLSIDLNMLAFTTGLAVITCLLFGVGPAIRATSAPPALAMQGGRGTAQFAERQHLRRGLVVVQVAISLILLFGALLFGQTLRNLLGADSGMTPEGVLVASVDARLPDLPSSHRRVVFDEMQRQISALPGVQSAAQVWLSPFGGSGWNGSVRPPEAPADQAKESWFNRVGPGYFATLETRLLAGRDITAQDTLSSPLVAVINEEFAKQVFGAVTPIGRRFKMDAPAGEKEDEYEVIGLVRNTRYNGLREDVRAIAFMPVAQEKDPTESMSFVVRSHAPLGTTMNGIRQLMTTMQDGLLVEFRVLDVVARRSVLRERLMANVSGAFGILATLLAAIGLYGVMSYMVARRRNEFGVRMALGATTEHVLGLVFSEAGRLVVLGLVVGAVGAYFAARYAQSLLYGLQFHDLRMMAVGCGLLLLVGGIAALLPAWRALRFDPAVVLRTE